MASPASCCVWNKIPALHLASSDSRHCSASQPSTRSPPSLQLGPYWITLRLHSQALSLLALTAGGSARALFPLPGLGLASSFVSQIESHWLSFVS